MNAEERELEIARCLYREANDAFFLFDLESYLVVDLNPAAQRLTGLEKAAARMMSLGDLFTGVSSDGLDRLVEALDARGFSTPGKAISSAGPRGLCYRSTSARAGSIPSPGRWDWSWPATSATGSGLKKISARSRQGTAAL